MLTWIEVDDDRVQATDMVEQLVPDGFGDVVCGSHGQSAVDHQVSAGDEAVTHPANAHALDLDDTIYVGGDLLDLAHERWVDGIHQPLEHRPRRVTQDP